MRKSYKVSLVIALLFPLFSMFQVKSSFAADTSTTVGDVQIPPSAVIKTVGTDPKEVSYYSNSDKLSYTTVTVNPPAGKTVTRVVLRKKNKQEIRDLPLVSGNQYQLGDIEGERVNLTASEKVPDGYFGWFRAPNRQKIWMYDLNNVRHTQYGVGGLPQVFVPNVKELIEKGVLKPIQKISLLNSK